MPSDLGWIASPIYPDLIYDRHSLAIVANQQPRLTFREQLVGGFFQMPLGALSICQVSNQLSGKLVNVHASEVIDLLSLEIEDGPAKDDRYVDATAVEYFSVHDLPPIEGPCGKGCACWAAIARQIALGLFPFRLQEVYGGDQILVRLTPGEISLIASLCEWRP